MFWRGLLSWTAAYEAAVAGLLPGSLLFLWPEQAINWREVWWEHATFSISTVLAVIISLGGECQRGCQLPWWAVYLYLWWWPEGAESNCAPQQVHMHMSAGCRLYRLPDNDWQLVRMGGCYSYVSAGCTGVLLPTYRSGRQAGWLVAVVQPKMAG